MSARQSPRRPLPDRVRATLDRRNGSTAEPHRNRKRYHRPTAKRATRQEI